MDRRDFVSCIVAMLVVRHLPASVEPVTVSPSPHMMLKHWEPLTSEEMMELASYGI
jgi:hypothetical protein